MSRPPARYPRVIGVYHRRSRGDWIVCSVDAGGDRKTESFPTEGKAQRWARGLEESAALAHGRTLSEAVDGYEEAMRLSLKPRTLAQNLYRLRRFFGAAIDTHLASVTTSQIKALYAALVSEGVSAATHRAMLKAARTFFRWCIGRSWLTNNPADGVAGVGKVRKGKAQLTVDEARRWEATAQDLATAYDAGAVAALTALYTGLRAGEICGLQVRDLDDGATLIWVREAKTEAGRRTVGVPDEIREHLATLAHGRAGDEPLFAAELVRYVGGADVTTVCHHEYGWVTDQVERICALAAVPRVTAHGMRGLHASLRYAAGQDREGIARGLGHTSPTITEAHYATRTAIEGGAQRAALRVLRGGRTQ